LEFPKALQSRYWSMSEIAQELNDDEAALDLPLSKTLDPGFVAVAQRWAGGRELDAVLAEGEITGGDFVRTIKILIDLLRQISKVSTNLATAKTARQAADALFRGVVKASSLDQLGDVVGSVDFSPDAKTEAEHIPGPPDRLDVKLARDRNYVQSISNVAGTEEAADLSPDWVEAQGDVDAGTAAEFDATSL
jgi:superfamily II RNA helicase